jgi:hypothetical protein
MKPGKANQKPKRKERTFETQITIKLYIGTTRRQKKKKKSQHRI